VIYIGTSNGGDGPIGENAYLSLWHIEQLVSLNDAYHVSEFAPSFVLFGSDGGDTAYAFDRREPGRIVALPFVGMRDDAAEVLGSSFAEFLERLGQD
jgi:hypothetical protein